MSFYHAMNRGNDKRVIALDDRDRLRFVRNLYEMNDDNPTFNLSRHARLPDLGGQVIRDPLVHVHGWCLMRNHYHLFLTELKDGGISKFLMKLNVGYVKYFNERHRRVGTLFQGKTKKVLIERDAHFLYLLLYIHCNPLDYLPAAKEWRQKKVASSSDAINWLLKYRWSSLPDYAGSTDFAKILEGSWLYEERSRHLPELKKYLGSIQSNGLTAALQLE